MGLKKQFSDNFNIQSLQDSASVAIQTIRNKIKGISDRYDLKFPTNAPSSTLPLMMTSTGQITADGLGVTDGSSAATGIVGEVVKSTAAASFAASGTWGDATSISLTAGDWDLTGVVNASFGSASTFQRFFVGISSTSGNSGSGLSTGDNLLTFIGASSGGTDNSGVIPSHRVNITATTAYYLKLQGTFTGTAPTFSARLSARRIR